MTVWVRTQDRESLTKVIWFGIDGKKIKALRSTSEMGITLGTYKDNERAMEILNYIQTKILDEECNNVVIEMPKE